MKNQPKPVEKVTIDEAGSEKLSNEMNDAADKIQLSIHIGNPKSFYIRLTREGCELKIRWTRAVAGVAGIIGLMNLLF
jgi:tRNA(Ser,Leu) C12 N-acetylase TAN1